MLSVLRAHYSFLYGHVLVDPLNFFTHVVCKCTGHIGHDVFPKYRPEQEFLRRVAQIPEGVSLFLIFTTPAGHIALQSSSFTPFAFARELLKGVQGARKRRERVFLGDKRAKRTLMASARGWWRSMQAQRDPARGWHVSVRVSPKGGPRGGRHFLVGCAQLASPRGGMNFAREITAGAFQLERHCTRLAVAERATTRQWSRRLGWLEAWLVLTGAWALFWVLPCSLKRRLEMSPHPLVSSAQCWQRSVLAKVSFSA